MSDEEEGASYVYSDYEDEGYGGVDAEGDEIEMSQSGGRGGGAAAAASQDVRSGGSAASQGSLAGVAASAAAAWRAAAAAGREYRQLDHAEVAREMKLIAGDVASILNLPAEAATALLNAYKWNKERLFDAFMADPKAVSEAVGVTHTGRGGFLAGLGKAGDFECSICWSDVPAADGYTLGCEHAFCRTCWADFLTSQVADQGMGCVFAKCPSGDCGEAVPLSAVKALGTPDVIERWERFQLQQFVNISKDMAWCPNGSCGSAFKSRGLVKTVECGCGTRFCFRCSREAHEPIVCDVLESWLQKCGNESETANWMLANTKKCPLCGVRIEKDKGCNHMVCRNKGCKHEFCWVCLGAWATHGQSTGGYYNCNKYRGEGPVDNTNAARAKAELDRYLFFYQRFHNHDLSGKYAAKSREAARRRMADLQVTGGLAYTDVSFLNDATEALLECRRVLKYTYVYGFYLWDIEPASTAAAASGGGAGGAASSGGGGAATSSGGGAATAAASSPRSGGGGAPRIPVTPAERRLFEALQEQLERSTEHLAELTEQPVDKMDRREVVNYTRVTSTFLKNLLQGIEDGLAAAGQ